MTIAMSFLIVYFAWRLFSGISNKKKGSVSYLLRNGIEAEAIVLSVQPTGLEFDNMPQVKLQMQVVPECGRNYVTEIEEILSYKAISSIVSGRRVRVRYNPRNPKEVRLLM